MILYDNRWVGLHGIGRFAKEVMIRLNPVVPLNGNLDPLHPLNPLYLSWAIRKNKPSVYFTPGFNPPLFCSVPFIFTIHDLNHIRYAPNSSLFKNTYYEYFLKPLCHRAFKVLTVSNFSRRCIIEWANLQQEHIINVGNGISEQYNINGDQYKPGYPYILAISNTKPHKNLPRLLDAFSLSKAKNDVKLIIIGELDSISKTRITENGLENKIILTGSLQEEQMPRYYRGAEALIFPSLYEGFGLPVAEAMSCGTPVVTSGDTALPEVAGNAALLVDPRNTEEIASAMDTILYDSELRDKLRREGIIQSKLFSWDKTASLIQAVLDQAISSNIKACPSL